MTAISYIRCFHDWNIPIFLLLHYISLIIKSFNLIQHLQLVFRGRNTSLHISLYLHICWHSIHLCHEKIGKWTEKVYTLIPIVSYMTFKP